jgi:hypothetical protein
MSRWLRVESIDPRPPAEQVDALMLEVAGLLDVQAPRQVLDACFTWPGQPTCCWRPLLRQVTYQRLREMGDALDVSCSWQQVQALYLPEVPIIVFPTWETRWVIAHELAHLIDDKALRTPREAWEPRACAVEAALWNKGWA